MIYTDGTIAIKAGSPIVTGTGTQWKKNIHGVAPGQLICIENGVTPVSMMIRAVNSDTELVLSFNSPVTLSGAKYSIATTVPDTISDAARTMSANQGYIVYFLQAMQQWMTDTGQVEIELPSGQKVTLEDVKGLASREWVNGMLSNNPGNQTTVVKAVSDSYLWVSGGGQFGYTYKKQNPFVVNASGSYASLNGTGEYTGFRLTKSDGRYVLLETNPHAGSASMLSIAYRQANGENQHVITIPYDSGALATQGWIGRWGYAHRAVRYKNADLLYVDNGCSFFVQGGGGDDNYFSAWGAGIHMNYYGTHGMRLFINGWNAEVIANVRYSSGEMKWNTLWGNANTTVDGNGFIKRSSPVIQIYPDGNYEINDESEGAEVRRTGTGQYHITGILGYNSDGAWGVNGGISVPKDNNGLELVYVDDRVQEDGSIIIETCHRQHAHLPERFQNWRLKEITPEGERIFYQDGEPCDLPESTRLDVRVEMPQGSVWNVKQRELAEQMEREQAEREEQEAAEQAGDSEE
ncbi:hypothetical protein [Morganella morganii]|uniref:phage tail fiber protein n=1 Tax=Morganella morganii TaxID=582 RepID=UPI003EC012E1